MSDKPKNYMNPYLAGIMLGLVLLATIYITGRGLGASGAMKSVEVGVVNAIAPNHTANAKFYQEYFQEHPNGIFNNWLVFEVVGVILGAFLSGLVSNRLTFKLERPEKVKSATRIVGAFVGGMFFGLGAQFARGCTSGAALSGMAVLSTGGIITMFCIFGGAYLFAYFFRKLWL
ncbi:MAG TPA: YeeE/YedE thiosulfate transporter family protein [Bacteroidota bacterium]|nr:YeeE/YedE thiosulfate transporter family protein [Candidatus Kapabacteria bacterium]HRS02286.1 YeeE/YedE thiosulfate transporter family protein [Bacteroidota bacterium]HRT67477.1 YeeE/YedE thiosulfate transporter family protein [Bacteroidota bacterium]